MGFHTTTARVAAIAWASCTVALLVMAAAPASADVRTYFTGTETYTDGGSPIVIPANGKIHLVNTIRAVEAATDPRLCGDSMIGVHAIYQPPDMTGPMWGSFHLANAGGEWHGHWVGSRTLTAEGIVSEIVATSAGSGGYEGLVARWTLRGVNVTSATHFEGFIVESGAADLPITYRATRTETLDTVSMEFNILAETALGTHVGRATNQGVGFVLPPAITGGAPGISGMGTMRAANGDLVYWVVSGSIRPGEELQATIHLAAGTGRFEATLGRMDGTFIAGFGPPDENGIRTAVYSFTVAGFIRY